MNTKKLTSNPTLRMFLLRNYREVFTRKNINPMTLQCMFAYIVAYDCLEDESLKPISLNNNVIGFTIENPYYVKVITESKEARIEYGMSMKDFMDLCEYSKQDKIYTFDSEMVNSVIPFKNLYDEDINEEMKSTYKKRDRKSNLDKSIKEKTNPHRGRPHIFKIGETVEMNGFVYTIVQLKGNIPIELNHPIRGIITDFDASLIRVYREPKEPGKRGRKSNLDRPIKEKKQGQGKRGRPRKIKYSLLDKMINPNW